VIRLLIFLLWGPHDCKKHGHDYQPRYDEMLDPRLSGASLASLFRSTYPEKKIYDVLSTRIYVKDICNYCGDVVERLEGMTPLEVLAHQAKRVAG